MHFKDAMKCDSRLLELTWYFSLLVLDLGERKKEERRESIAIYIKIIMRTSQVPDPLTSLIILMSLHFPHEDEVGL